MLLNLHVKNVALIDEADVSLGDGLNILTGETGAGKSILIDSVNMALGAKVSRSLLRDDGEAAGVELLFSVEEEKREALEALGVTPDEDGSVLIARRLSQGRSICRINDETVTAARLRAVTGLLIDIHGQHEHQSLIHKAKHLEILDAYAKNQEAPVRRKLSDAYRVYEEAKAERDSYEIGSEERIRELDFLNYEIGELEGAGLKPGELEELESRFRLLANSRRIAESVGRACGYAGNESGAQELLGRAVRELFEAAGYDESVAPLLSQAEEVESLLGDLNRALYEYVQELEVEDGELEEMEKRLDVLHNLQVKYGDSYEEMMQALEKRQGRRDQLLDFDTRKQQAEEAFLEAEEEVMTYAASLSEIRKVEALHLTESIRSALVDLNFLDVQFSMEFTKKDHVTENGFDEMEFLISTNPGESLKPLGQVASGGELSRIMLAIKAVLADTDEIGTLIFDEIDAGISGRTAQKVAEKLHDIGRSHQVICITHLPQIAAMADCHYKIEKKVENGRTITGVEQLDEDQEIAELCRLLGGVTITDAVEENAREMKTLAKSYR